MVLALKKGLCKWDTNGVNMIPNHIVWKKIIDVEI